MHRPKSFDWDRATETARQGMQGQRFSTVISSQNAPGTAACKVIISMPPGKVSNVHIHENTHVYVDVLDCGPGGVLTLAGDKLEFEVWTFRRQSLWIPPGVPHVAVYPRTEMGADSVEVTAMETRLTSSATADVVPLDAMGELLTRRLDDLRLTGLVTPSAQMAGYRRDESSCFPPMP